VNEFSLRPVFGDMFHKVTSPVIQNVTKEELKSSKQ